MDIVRSAKKIGSEIERGVEVVANKVADTFDNLASHLPFSNIAKKDDSSFYIEVDLPGVKKEDVEIKLEDGVLVVSAVRRYKNELTRDNYHVCESSFGKFERRYIVPDSINTDKVNASLNDGRLVVELQKNKKAQAKLISIK
ncbi:MAG: Hsp20/alpha crystallin family protein [Sulfurimonas sp.]|nr:Hsp20/alpha crystallin family protein [Sulfurimonas sp.]